MPILMKLWAVWRRFGPLQAVDEAMHFLSLFMNVAGGMSVSSVVEMIACLVLTVRVVTIPIIMRWVTVTTRLVFAASSFSAKCIGDSLSPEHV